MIRGTKLKDYIVDTNNPDIIYGLSGDDEISSRSGGDLVYGGDGNDFILLSGDNSKAFGGAGHDFISGNGALYGGLGNDEIYSYGRSVVNGGDGSDRIEVRGDYSKIFDGSGDDFVFLGSKSADLFLGKGLDTVGYNFDVVRYLEKGQNVVYTIHNFDVNQDILDLYSGTELSYYSEARQVGRNVVIDTHADEIGLHGHAYITLINVSLTDIQGIF